MTNLRIWVVEKIDEWDGQVNTSVELFISYDEAREYMESELEAEHCFIDDVKDAIRCGNEDCSIIDEETFFYCYDALNFNAITITLKEMEVN